ncbi:hypothetical protein QP938_12540 [Porticoccaceae bacterium LTM1]|nr:hypothetical protein QP938_12540 [Porticoccaceae bacterium LTM1]
MNTATRKHIPLITFLVAVVLATALYLVLRPAPVINLTLRLDAIIDSEPLVLNQLKYPNPGGEGNFKIRDFQFYLTNIVLTADGESYVEPDSYHLARFDGASPSYAITLEGIPNNKYHTLSFAIGVDPNANKSIASRGDLNPNSRMAWSWDVGYKFVLLEGQLDTGGELIPLVYHIGFDENYKPLEFNLAPSLFTASLFGNSLLAENLFGGSNTTVALNVDPTRLFKGQQVVDLTALPSVKFDHDDARLIADNYQDMITLQ